MAEVADSHGGKTTHIARSADREAHGKPFSVYGGNVGKYDTYPPCLGKKWCSNQTTLSSRSTQSFQQGFACSLLLVWLLSELFIRAAFYRFNFSLHHSLYFFFN